MSIRTALWKVDPQPQPLAESSLVNEQLLEDMIAAAPRHLTATAWRPALAPPHCGRGEAK